MEITSISGIGTPLAKRGFHKRCTQQSNLLAKERSMVPRNISWSLSHVPLDGTPSAHWVAQQIETYFATHPEISWESFLLVALRRELAFRNSIEESHKRPLARILRSEPSD